MDITAICNFDFMRCQKCGRICTKPEILRSLGIGGTGSSCPCGSMKYSPANLPWWGWFLPRVWKFAYLRLRGAA